MSTKNGKSNPKTLFKQRTCRLCTNEGQNFVSIFNGSEEIRRMIKCLPVQIRPNDDLPHYICPGCRDALDVTYNLNILSLKAHLNLLEKARKLRLQKEVPSPRILTSTPRTSRATNDLQPEASTSQANKSVPSTSQRQSNQNTRRNLSDVFQKAPKVEQTTSSKISSENISGKRGVNDISQISVKEEPIYSNASDTVDPGPHRRRGRSRTQRLLPEEAVSPPRASRRRPKDEPKSGNKPISVKEEVESKILRTKPISLQCSECNQVFRSTSIATTKRKRIIEGGAAPICRDCGKLGKRTILPSSDEHAAKRRRHDTETINDGPSNTAKDVKKSFKSPENEIPKPKEHIKKEKTSTHKATVKKEPNNKRVHDFVCTDCNLNWNSHSAWQYHQMKYHVPPEEWEHVCRNCGVRYCFEWQLANHKKFSRCLPRSLKCPNCIHTFTRSSHLATHMQIMHSEDSKDK